MIYLIHGENEVENLNSISKIVKENGYKDYSSIEIEQYSENQLLTKLSSVSLFEDKSMYAIKITPIKVTKGHLQVFEKVATSNDFIIYCNKDIKSNAFYKKIVAIKGTKSIFNKKEIYDNVFAFTDALFLKDRKKTYIEYNKLLQVNADSTYILNMIMYALRNVTFAVYQSDSLKKNPPFKVPMYKKQASLFTQDKIKKIYNNLYQLEMNIKKDSIDSKIVVFNAIEIVLNS